jgi:DNA polymerase I-like protein with 3'-5' exonuclease and polymerase domains
VIAEQMIKISQRYRVVLTVHDAIACIAREEEKEEALQYVTECMRWRPEWAKTLPLNCEASYGNSYGDC